MKKWSRMLPKTSCDNRKTLRKMIWVYVEYIHDKNSKDYYLTKSVSLSDPAKKLKTNKRYKRQGFW